MTQRHLTLSLTGLLCVVAAVLLSLPVHATTVVALLDRRHHRVVVAADSLLVYTVAQTSTQTCKIVAKPGCTFAMAGLFSKEYPVFRLQELAEQACALPGDLQRKADGFLDIAKDPVMSVAQYLQQNEPQFYRELTTSNGGELVIVVFAGPQAGSPSTFARGYRLDAGGGITPLSMDVTESNNGEGFFGGAKVCRGRNRRPPGVGRPAGFGDDDQPAGSAEVGQCRGLHGAARPAGQEEKETVKSLEPAGPINGRGSDLYQGTTSSRAVAEP